VYNTDIMKDDASHVVAHKAGDQRAFGSLVEAYLDRVFSFALRLSGDRAIAEDAAQETFIKAWKGMGSFDEKRPFRAWLFSIARNTTVDIMRKRKDVLFGSLDASSDDDAERFADGLPDDAPLPDIMAEGRELSVAVEAILARLGVEDRTIVTLHDVEGMTFSDISDIVGKPLNTVKSRYRRALLALRARLGGSRDAMHQKDVSERIS
jgi:RNA polymerase sigma-70 factor (ECF subfamily)